MPEKKLGGGIFPAHKPAEDEKEVLLWTGRYWEFLNVHNLENDDIWRSMPPPPSERLQARAKERAGS